MSDHKQERTVLETYILNYGIAAVLRWVRAGELKDEAERQLASWPEWPVPPVPPSPSTTSPTELTCDTCCYYTGLCRRYPSFIAVRAQDWCGEWQARG